MALSIPMPVLHVRRRGVSLVELMVGIALGMLIAAALLLLFANASSNGKELQRSGEQIENGRYAVEMLRDDVQMAGFFGEAPITVGYTLPDPCATAPAGAFTPPDLTTSPPTPMKVPTPVRGYGSAEALSCLTSRNRLAGTDALAVRRLDTVSLAQADVAATNKQYQVQYSFCDSGLDTTPLVFDKTKAAFTMHNKACTGINPVRAYVSRVYFVAACSRCGAGGDSYPTLKRLDLVDDTLVETALVEGIESLRIEYGFDTDGNGSVDEYRSGAATAGPASLWQNVVAVKLHMITRSLSKASGALATAQTFELGGLGTVNTAADGYVRRAYSTTIRLINPSGARDLQ